MKVEYNDVLQVHGKDVNAPSTIATLRSIVAVLDDALPMLIQQNPSAFDGISEKLAPLDGLLSDE